MLTENDMMLIRIQDSLDINGYAGGIGYTHEEINEELTVIRGMMVRLTEDKVFRTQNKELHARAEDRFNKMFRVLLVRREKLMRLVV